MKKTIKKSTKPKKLVAKKFKPISLGKRIKVQDADYWKDRPVDDDHVDWTYNEKTWLEGYVLSVDHMHRHQITNALEKFKPFGGVLEVGCNTGANLLNISEMYPENQMAGIDVNADAIAIAKNLLPKAILEVGNYENIPFHDKSFDVVIADATLLYCGPDKINQVLDEMERVSKKGMILVERFAPSEAGEVVGNVWGRDYKTLLEKRGYEVEEDSVVWETSKNWIKHGRLYIALKV